MFKQKNILLDTSVLIANPKSIHQFPDSNVFITLEVLEELDKLKTRNDTVGKSARYVNKYLDGIREQGSLFTGITIENNQCIFVVDGKGEISSSLSEINNDNKIITVAEKLNKDIGITVLSNDIAFRVKCDSLNIPAEGYEAAHLRKDFEQYTGVRVVGVSKTDLEDFYENGMLNLTNEDFFPNEYLILKNEKSSALAMSPGGSVIKKLSFAGEKNFTVEGIKPKSSEQVFALESLLNPEVSLVTLTGMAGTGKTFLAILSALHNFHQGVYDKIIISRPMESSSKDIGFLPGDKFEKMLPWVQPIFDNLSVILAKKKGFSYIEMMLEKGQLEVEAMTYVRGRSLPNTVFIIDEAQNITYDEAKALITRMGERSKIILIGDLEQIDSQKLTQISSGLSSVVELFKTFDGAAHLMLRRGERSKLATFAAENM